LGPLTAGMLLDLGWGPYSVFTLYGTSAAIAAAAMAVFAVLPNAHEPAVTVTNSPGDTQTSTPMEGVSR
jgi:hypothetical protein